MMTKRIAGLSIVMGLALFGSAADAEVVHLMCSYRLHAPEVEHALTLDLDQRVATLEGQGERTNPQGAITEISEDRVMWWSTFQGDHIKAFNWLSLDRNTGEITEYDGGTTEAGGNLHPPGKSLGVTWDCKKARRVF